MKILLYFYVALIPFEHVLTHIVGEASVYKPYRIAAMLLFVTVAVRGLVGKPLRVGRYSIALLVLLCGGMTIAALWSSVGQGEISAAVNDFSLALFGFATFVVVQNVVTRLSDISRLLWVYVGAVAGAIAVSLYSGISGFERRIAGFYRNPNQLAQDLAVCSLFMIASFAFGTARRSWLSSLVSGGLALGAAALILFTGSRTALIALAGAVAALLARRSALGVSAGSSARRRKTLVVLAVCSLIAAVGYGLSGEVFDETALVRYQARSLEGTSGRYDLWRSAIRLALETYLVGLGTGQYRHYHATAIENIEDLRTPDIAQYQVGTHSDYTELLVGYGLAGLLLFVLVMWSLGVRLYHAALAPSEPPFVRAFLWAAFVFLLIMQGGHQMLGGPTYWLLLGCCAVSVDPVAPISHREHESVAPSKAAHR